MRDELVDIVNDQDEVTGTVLKSVAHAEGIMIRIIHVFVVNPQGEMAMQLRSRKVSYKPGHWVTAGSGHVQAGEAYDAAGYRELQEELGIAIPLKFAGTDLYTDPRGFRERLGVMSGTYHGKFVVDPDVVEDVQWFSLATIQQMVNAGGMFHPEFLFLLKKRFGIT